MEAEDHRVLEAVVTRQLVKTQQIEKVYYML
jgi:hypothetical protein